MNEIPLADEPIANNNAKTKGFLRSLFSRAATPDAACESSSDYCRRLLHIYNSLAPDCLVSPLPDWVERGILAEGGKPPAFRLTIDGLRDVPRLQAALADCTAYTPWKWLLEQELKAYTLGPEAAAKLDREKGSKSWNENLGDVYDTAQDVGLAGLAFSGGGIRSATFCLGILQALAADDELSRFDYLSSVSGGGYIHQWFASWVYRQAPALSKLKLVQKHLKPLPQPGSGARWPSQILWLIRYSSYLTPQRGIFSADTWTMLCNWFRNTFLNQIVLFGFLATAILLIRLVAEPFFPSESPGADTLYRTLGLVLFLVIASQLIGSFCLLRALRSQQIHAVPGIDPRGALNDLQVLLCIVLPALLGAYGVALRASLYPEVHWFPPYFTTLWGVQIFFLLLAMVFGSPLPAAPLKWRRYSMRVRAMAVVTAALLASGMGSAANWLATSAPQTQHARLSLYSISAAKTLNQRLASRSDTIKLHQQADAAAGGPFANIDLQYTSSSRRDPAPPILAQALFCMLAPLLFLGLQFVAIRLQIGVLGDAWAESRREWMARLGAWTAIVSLLWFLLGFMAGIGPALCGWILDPPNRHRLWVSLSGVVALHAATLYAGASGKSDGKPQSGALLGYKPIDLLGIVGAPLCIFSLLLILSALMHGLVAWLGEHWDKTQEVLHGIAAALGLAELAGRLESHVSLAHTWLPWFSAKFAHANHLGPTLLLAVSLALLFVFFAWRVDINEFSIHAFYRNRLARCYIGATNMLRSPDRFTKLDEHTETGSTRPRVGITVASLLPERFGGIASFAQPTNPDERGFDGPFPIFCSTLTLTFGQDLAYQERKGASFAFTPLYSGYHVGWTAETGRKKPDTTFNGYVLTKDYAYRNGGVSLASAAAISGAALSPNQGVSSQPALAFLMTLFNVRLGWWIANPRKPAVWSAESGRPTPAFGLGYLLGELLGLANDTSKYVSLSDGGKFDNMALYELVRRRCTFIVVCDAESDAKCQFEGIGLAISKCRTDFGAEITLDLSPLRPDPITGNARAHFVEGKIRYPAPPGRPCHKEYVGRIFYVKSTVVGDETSDILHHKLTHSDFPNDSTLNQWFNESKFEAYRRLGQLSGEQLIHAFPGPPRPAGAPKPPNCLPAVPHAGWSELVSYIKRH